MSVLFCECRKKDVEMNLYESLLALLAMIATAIMAFLTVIVVIILNTVPWVALAVVLVYTLRFIGVAI